ILDMGDLPAKQWKDAFAEVNDFTHIIVDNGTSKGKKISKDTAKGIFAIQGSELEPLVGGTTSGTALVVPNGPAGVQRTAEVSSGKWYDFGSGPVEASAGRRWKSYWNGTSWVLKDLGELPNNSAKAPDWTPGTYDKNIIVIFENVLYRANKQTSAAPVTGGA